MTNEELIAVVRLTLQLSKNQWVRYGTPIKPEDAELVAIDVLAALTPPSAAVGSDKE